MGKDSWNCWDWLRPGPDPPPMALLQLLLSSSRRKAAVIVCYVAYTKQKKR